MSHDFNSSRILLLGLGREGNATLNFLLDTHPSAVISVADQSGDLVLTDTQRAGISKCYLKDKWLEGVGEAEAIIVTPGIPRTVRDEVKKRNPKATITSATQIFLERHRAKVWGVTGTKGKSTTSSLLSATLNACGIRAVLCGNIGIPALSVIDQEADVYVMELSSYQLEDLTVSPHGALFLNLYPEHLDHHGSFESYRAAKLKILNYQQNEDIFARPAEGYEFLNRSVSKQLTFSENSPSAFIRDNSYYINHQSFGVKRVCSTDETLLKGPGNRSNILAVLTALTQFDITIEGISNSIKNFAPLPHRLEVVGTFKGITFINDSISTVPQATINALETFGNDVETLILGGFDRGVSFEELAKYLAHSNVKNLILFPPSGARIVDTITQNSDQDSFVFHYVDTMTAAVQLSYDVTSAGKICLLSPASPSFPIFKNFEERGRYFREGVKGLSGSIKRLSF